MTWVGLTKSVEGPKVGLRLLWEKKLCLWLAASTQTREFQPSLTDSLPNGFLIFLASPSTLRANSFHYVSEYISPTGSTSLAEPWRKHQGSIVMNKWIWLAGSVSWGFHIWMERESKALGGHRLLIFLRHETKAWSLIACWGMDLAPAGHRG